MIRVATSGTSPVKIDYRLFVAGRPMLKKQLVVKIWNFTEAYRVDCWRLGSGSAPYHRVDARRVSQQRVLQPRQPETKEGDGNGSFI
jgi:hypothetical protein